MAAEILPEFFLFLGIDFFVALSLLTCLMDRFHRLTSYLYEAAAIFGYINLLMSREFLATFGEYMRFSYSFLYLTLALANIVGINIYLMISGKSWNLGKVFAGSITFPAILITTFFFSLYGRDFSHVLTAALLSSVVILGVGIAFLVRSPERTETVGRR